MEFTWVEGRTLDWIRQNKESIKTKHAARLMKDAQKNQNKTLHEVFEEEMVENSSSKACIVCDL